MPGTRSIGSSGSGRDRAGNHRATLKHPALSKDIKDQDGIIQCLEGLAGAASLQQNPERAARLFGAAMALRASIGLPVHPFNRPRYQRIEEGINKQLPAEAFESEQAIGKGLTLERAIDYALQGIDKLS